jgi:hypothetical protein
MEILEEKIKEFIKISNGYGYGSGNGSGSGSGNGYGNGSGYGSGNGSGSGDGNGSGSGNGYGYGYGLKTINKLKIYKIDNVNTVITSVHNNIAKGFIFNDDLTLKKCYIAKGQEEFAHGETMKEAVKALRDKIYESMDIEEAMEKFISKFKQKNRKYKAIEFYNWHHFLTGSCEMGRKSFAYNHNIDINNDKFTVLEFIELTQNDFGGEIIKKLREYYK